MRMRTAVRPRLVTRPRMCSPTMNSRRVRSSPSRAVVNPVATTYGTSGLRPSMAVACTRMFPLEGSGYLEREHPRAFHGILVAKIAIRPRDKPRDGGGDFHPAERLLEMKVPFGGRES